ncbi:hypothetical protein K435DRAFT_905411 [Dendrothele bispora CBS 962.96]|uniref:Uncharacterized protein n=1 Tax=Dendrothele bispora (strain CBS 962.96) TaxID=1314807 RepID=A0A4S8LTA0_DENBC|nr:hypothetical protein K435DRAFT_905411 [Dendrothele bispora CBS 962.96]
MRQFKLKTVNYGQSQIKFRNKPPKHGLYWSNHWKIITKAKLCGITCNQVVLKEEKERTVNVLPVPNPKLAAVDSTKWAQGHFQVLSLDLATTFLPPTFFTTPSIEQSYLMFPVACNRVKELVPLNHLCFLSILDVGNLSVTQESQVCGLLIQKLYLKNCNSIFSGYALLKLYLTLGVTKLDL